MATLSKIRSKSGWLIVIIGGALFAFVLGDLFKSGSSILKGDQNIVGVIDGREVTYQEFNPEVAKASDAYKRQGLTSSTQISNIVWNNLERRILIENEVKKLGLNIGEDELWNLIITDPSIANTPNFINEFGIFDQSKVAEYLALIKSEAGKNVQALEMWSEWLSFEAALKDRGIVQSYYNLISAGLNSTNFDGELLYKNQGDQADASYVFLPYSSVSDSLVKVSDDEVNSYVEAHADDFKVEAQRDIQYVLFELKPSLSDEAQVKEELLSLLEDKVLYNTSSSSYDTIAGFRNTKQDSIYVNNHSDERFQNMYYHKGALSDELEKFAFSAKVGDLYGPYNEEGSLKVSKLVSVKSMPDSVKASHILISFAGAREAAPSIVRTPDQAKAIADSLVRVLNNKKGEFAELASTFSDGPTATNGGDLGWFTYGTMVPEFNNFCFNNRKGSVGVVKTVFGYHVVKIEDQKNIEQAVKLATLSREVIPSEETENKVDAAASNFAFNNKSLESFQASAVASNLQARNVEGLEAMDFNIPGVGDQREIVKWAFDSETEVNQTKVFDVPNGSLVVIMYSKSEEGLADASVARPQVEFILRNQKKAKLLKEKIKGSTLEEIAKNAGVEVRQATSLYFENPIIATVGREPKVVGTIFGLKEGVVSDAIEGSTGVFVAKRTALKEAVQLPNYATYSNRLKSQYTSRVNSQLFEALKKSVVIKDNRARFGY